VDDRGGARGGLDPAYSLAREVVSGLSIGWLLFFSPGWANGFPFGLSFQAVLSAGMTCQILLMLMTVAAAVAAIVGFTCTLLGVEWEYLGRGHRIWLWFAALILCISAGIFTVVCVWVGKLFPDGYMIS
jgi:hypothetical protein